MQPLFAVTQRLCPVILWAALADQYLWVSSGDEVPLSALPTPRRKALVAVSPGHHVLTPTLGDEYGQVGAFALCVSVRLLGCGFGALALARWLLRVGVSTFALLVIGVVFEALT